jgi:hypothetical protein
LSHIQYEIDFAHEPSFPKKENPFVVRFTNLPNNVPDLSSRQIVANDERKGRH